MELTLVLRGLVIGVSIAAPVGPIGVLCIRRTLAEGRAIGFASGMGAATADTIYGCIAALGLSVVTTLLIDQLFWVRCWAGCFCATWGSQRYGLRQQSTPPPGPGAAAQCLWLDFAADPGQPGDDSIVHGDLGQPANGQQHGQLQ